MNTVTVSKEKFRATCDPEPRLFRHSFNSLTLSYIVGGDMTGGIKVEALLQPNDDVPTDFAEEMLSFSMNFEEAKAWADSALTTGRATHGPTVLRRHDNGKVYTFFDCRADGRQRDIDIDVAGDAEFFDFLRAYEGDAKTAREVVILKAV